MAACGKGWQLVNKSHDLQTQNKAYKLPLHLQYRDNDATVMYWCSIHDTQHLCITNLAYQDLQAHAMATDGILWRMIADLVWPWPLTFASLSTTASRAPGMSERRSLRLLLSASRRRCSAIRFMRRRSRTDCARLTASLAYKVFKCSFKQRIHNA